MNKTLALNRWVWCIAVTKTLCNVQANVLIFSWKLSQLDSVHMSKSLFFLIQPIACNLHYHQHTKYLQFDWLMNTKYFAYLKAAHFSSNLIGCQLKIILILTAASPLQFCRSFLICCLSFILVCRFQRGQSQTWNSLSWTQSEADWKYLEISSRWLVCNRNGIWFN